MAQVRLFKFDADGFQVEHGADDDITFRSFTGDPDSPGDSVFNAAGGRITNLADGTGAQDAVSKNQLDAVSAGIDLKEACRLKSSGDYSSWVGGGPSGVGHTLTSPDNLVANNDFDSVTAVLGDRVLVTGAGGNDTTADVENGIYTVTQLATGAAPTILTRATDFDGSPVGEVSNGAFAFIQEGTNHANEGWAIITADPITVDTTAIQFSQFQGLPNFTWGAGLLDTANTISVELDTGADAQGAGNGGGSSGLEFDAAGDAAQLRAAVNPTGGIERTASGVAAKLNGTTLESAAGGLSVKGVPALFEVGGAATTAGVTAANLNTLTDGSDASALHTHAGSAEAERIETAYTTDGTGVSKGDPLYVSANGVVSSINANNNHTRRYIGVAKSTVGASASVDVVSAGKLTGVSVGGAPSAGGLVYAAVGGGLTATIPTGSGNHRLVVGKIADTTGPDLQIEPQYLGKIA